MKIIGVIPARYQSSRFPGKPLAAICGKPMIWWVYQQAMRVSDFEQVVVATDDKRISNVCEQLDINVMLTSPTHPTGTDRMAEVAHKLEGDLFVNIQGDEPLVEPEIIETIIDYSRNNQEVDVINTMAKITDEDILHLSSVVKVAFNNHNDVIYLSRSIVPYNKSVLHNEYYRHLGMYGIKREALMFFAQTPRGRIEQVEDIEMFRFIENGMKIKILPINTSMVAVDHPEDVDRVEMIMKGECQ